MPSSTTGIHFLLSWHLLFDSPHHVPFRHLISDREKRRRDRRYPRSALRKYRDSPFNYILQSRSDQALLNATACDFEVFNELLSSFKPLYDDLTFDEKTGSIRRVTKSADGFTYGRPRELPAEGALGLVLVWYRTRGTCTRSLSLIFGSTSTPLYRWLKFSRQILLVAMQRHHAARIAKPSREEIARYTDAISAKYPVLQNVWGAADGLKLPIQGTASHLVQNRFYNGWYHGHYVSNVFVFAADGRICVTCFNSPGSWHDSTIADYGVYEKCCDIYNATGGRIVVDAAFKLGQQPYIVKSSQLDPIGDRHGVAVNRAATSVRQLSEWGMRMIQAQFPRLKDPLRYEDEGDRRVILTLMRQTPTTC